MTRRAPSSSHRSKTIIDIPAESDVYHHAALGGVELRKATAPTRIGFYEPVPLTTGTLDARLIHPREFFQAAIRDSASAILLVHNHPTPSREDKAVTERLSQVGELVGIRVLDHITEAKEGCRSVMAES